jgi:hypothetical protein
MFLCQALGHARDCGLHALHVLRTHAAQGSADRDFGHEGFRGGLSKQFKTLRHPGPCMRCQLFALGAQSFGLSPRISCGLFHAFQELRLQLLDAHGAEHLPHVKGFLRRKADFIDAHLICCLLQRHLQVASGL